MVHFSWRSNARTMFIVKQGILHWGTAVGIIITVVFVVANLGNKTFDSGWWRATALVALCFVESTIGAGWIIGSILWSVREQAAKRGPPHSR